MSSNVVSRLEMRVDNLTKWKEDEKTGGHKSAVNTLRAIESVCTPASSIISKNNALKKTPISDEKGLFSILEDGCKEDFNAPPGFSHNYNNNSANINDNYHNMNNFNCNNNYPTSYNMTPNGQLQNNGNYSTSY